MKKLKFGIPKGSLQQATVNICRAQEMPRYVENGTIDAGLTGKDWIEENESDVVVVDDLTYSKTSQKPARWVLAVPSDSNLKRLDDLQGKKIATELVNYTRRYFRERNIDVKIEFSWGATEAKAVSGLVDAIVEVTETGSTIRAHGLKIIHEFMKSNTQLIANRESYEDPWKKDKIEQIILLLKGALRAESLVGLKMNVPVKKIEAIINILPSLNAPTVAGLYNSNWVSVETVVDIKTVRNLIPKLLQAGAEGIIEYPLNKVV
jgi:ATP phosphoribosyltransferase